MLEQLPGYTRLQGKCLPDRVSFIARMHRVQDKFTMRVDHADRFRAKLANKETAAFVPGKEIDR